MAKTALITWWTSGIWKEFAYELAEQWYDIIIVWRNEYSAGSITKEIWEKYGVLCYPILADLATKEWIEKLVSHIQELTNLDILVNAAGFFNANDFTSADFEIWDRMTVLHCIATIQLSYAAAKKMQEKGIKWTIINISSVAAFLTAWNPMYVWTKAFIRKFSMDLHFELKKYWIYVQTLCPWYVKTHLFVEAFWGTPRVWRVKPKFVVRRSLFACKTKKVCCVPWILPKLLIVAMRVTPKPLVYKFTKWLIRY
jgi:hypothetical protein